MVQGAPRPSRAPTSPVPVPGTQCPVPSAWCSRQAGTGPEATAHLPRDASPEIPISELQKYRQNFLFFGKCCPVPGTLCVRRMPNLGCIGGSRDGHHAAGRCWWLSESTTTRARSVQGGDVGLLPPGLQLCGVLRAPGRGAGGQPGHSEPRAGALHCAMLWGTQFLSSARNRSCTEGYNLYLKVHSPPGPHGLFP